MFTFSSGLGGLGSWVTVQGLGFRDVYISFGFRDQVQGFRVKGLGMFTFS